jgi:hypothetical protein
MRALVFLVALFVLCSVVSGREVVVVNMMSDGLVVGPYTFNLGVHRFPTDGWDAGQWATWEAQFGPCRHDGDNECIFWGSGSLAQFSYDSNGQGGARTDINLWPACLAGMGCGFLWFGFGWILRLTKKVPGDW